MGINKSQKIVQVATIRQSVIRETIQWCASADDNTDTCWFKFPEITPSCRILDPRTYRQASIKLASGIMFTLSRSRPLSRQVRLNGDMQVLDVDCRLVLAIAGKEFVA